jgi:hypothetical protein
MSVILVVEQPCVLCQRTIMVQELSRDFETGEESWSTETVDHDCPPMRALKQERRPSGARPR